MLYDYLEAQKPAKKLRRLWMGPFKVIQKIPTGQCVLEHLITHVRVSQVHPDRLKKYYGNEEST